MGAASSRESRDIDGRSPRSCEPIRGEFLTDPLASTTLSSVLKRTIDIFFLTGGLVGMSSSLGGNASATSGVPIGGGEANEDGGLAFILFPFFFRFFCFFWSRFF